jgi:hypothetical protein
MERDEVVHREFLSVCRRNHPSGAMDEQIFLSSSLTQLKKMKPGNIYALIIEAIKAEGVSMIIT